MKSNHKIKIDTGLEEIVKITCIDRQCRFRLPDIFTCSFKRITIDNGTCKNREEKEDARKMHNN